MQVDRWREVESLLDRVLILPAADREMFLRAQTVDADLIAEVSSLAQSYEEAATKFESPPLLDSGLIGSLGIPPEEEPRAGLRVGPWILERLLGQGGMGRVYVGRRADAHFEKQVAIKVMRGSALDEEAARRFRNERQILAGLEHPNIARLIDGGVTADGSPYLVMEFVEGVPVDNYVREHALSPARILRLFAKVCDAVQYAHSHLIVHRDLKPGNILVTAEGEPKLLDFGIAKLIDESNPAENAATVTGMMMTPAYASPEQAGGKPVTTAADIYSLGVILFELLCGRRPFVCDTHNEYIAALLFQEAPAPHTVLKTIDADLDAIVLKALRKEPRDRYLSAEQFGQDVANYQDGKPVAARKGSAAYRARKYIRRHWVVVTAAALLLIAISAGVGGTLSQQRIAERRFDDVRKIARYLLFDVYDKASEIDGTTALRAEIVNRSVAYLDSLATDAWRDRGLALEVSEGYLRLGDVQGNLNTGSLGNRAGALAAYKKGQAIMSRFPPESLRDPEALRVAGLLEQQMGSMLSIASTKREGIDHLRRAVAYFEKQVQARPDDAAAQHGLGRSALLLSASLSQISGLITASDEADKWLKVADEHTAKSVALAPLTTRYLLDLAQTRHRLGVAIGDTQPAKAAEYYREASGVLDKIPEPYHSSYSSRKMRTSFLSSLGWSLGQSKQYDAAQAALDEAEATLKKMLAADPGNAGVKYDLTAVLRSSGIIYGYAGRHLDAARQYREAAKLHEDLLKKNPKTASGPLRAELLVRIGNELIAAGRAPEAVEPTRAGIAVMRQAAESPDATLIDYMRAGGTLLTTEVQSLRDPKTALLYAERALKVKDCDYNCYEILAEAQFQTGDPAHALQSIEKALSYLPPTPPGQQPTHNRGVLEESRERYRKAAGKK